MKRFLVAFVQFVAFFLVFAVGSFLPPFHIQTVLSVTHEGIRIFIWDGAILMVLLLGVILLVEVLRRRLQTSGPWTIGAFVAAAAVGFVAKLGFLLR